MTTIEFKAELQRIHQRGEEADKLLADIIVTGWCWVVIFAVVLVCVEVLT